ncbi:CaiB/BaiF CoA transferase family protein [Embleya sp. NBC_00896]|uniref:CaiB/BaiF CoA transferase family protein n=1 Tax=Embleya sp. NBC_00896 TaxID=2975961 RepID=UPI00386A2445|nr:CoA transferase [Embleya sp. NBC_00896]
MTARKGPLAGIRVVEFVGLGPGPFCGMLLADLGAEVLRIDRAADARKGYTKPPRNPMNRGKHSIAVDLKHPDGVALALRLVEGADALIEPFRPGVMERLGLGPDVCAERNPRLVYGRLTGWGQTGPLASAAGHDIDYIALAGMLEPIGRAGQPPSIPLNLVGDFGGGGLLLAFGLVAALLEAARSGRGQVVDAAMIDGAAALGATWFTMGAAGMLGPRGTNMLDGGAPFYDVYETSDARYVAVGAIEPRFWAELIHRLGLTEDPVFADLAKQHDPAHWPAMKARLGEVFAGRTRDAWCELLEGTETCFAPVLSPAEAPTHPHHVARGTFLHADGLPEPAPAPRFSRTPAAVPDRPVHPGPAEQGGDTDTALTAWGVPEAEITRLRDAGAVV